MLIDINSACKLLMEHDNILILAHQKPDGDTLGASFALMWALKSLGKRARVECSDDFPKRYGFVFEGYEPDTGFDPEYTVAVDIADASLIGPDDMPYANKINLCIDHHKSNTMYAEKTLLDVKAAAVSETVYEVVAAMGAPIDRRIANAIFTGLATDTGCFKFSNVTAKSHYIASKLIEHGAEHAKINKLIFDTKSRGVLMIERLMIETTAFYYNDRCAVAVLPADVSDKFGVGEDGLDGISSFTARIEGVMAGLTIRAKPDDTYRVSVRTSSPVDASRICAAFGGGGHMNAAGCTLHGELSGVMNSLLTAVKGEFNRHGID